MKLNVCCGFYEDGVRPQPVFTLHATLTIPTIVVKPSLDQVQEVLVAVGKIISGVSKCVGQWHSDKSERVNFLSIGNNCCFDTGRYNMLLYINVVRQHGKTWQVCRGKVCWTSLRERKQPLKSKTRITKTRSSAGGVSTKYCRRKNRRFPSGSETLTPQ